MNIGFDAKRVFFNQRGLGSYSRNLISGLLSFYPANQYFLYSPKIRSSSYFQEILSQHQNLNLRTPATWVPTFLEGIWRSYFLASQTGKDQLDIYHGLSHEIPYGLSKHTKTIVTVHDLIFLKYPRYFSPVDRRIYYHKIAYAVNAAHLVLAISEQTKKDLISWFRVSENKIRVVYQSCHELFYQNNHLSGDILTKFRLPEKYILYVGALVPHKNALSLIKALKHLKVSDHHLVVVGKGKGYYRQMMAYINEHGLYNRVHFISNQGSIDNRQLAMLYRGASLFVFPSLWEGFGIPVLEAMASGVPVIVNQNAGLTEAAGEAALAINVNDSMLLASQMNSIITDESLTNHLIQKGKLQAEKFRPRQVTAQLMQAYQEVLD